MEEIGVMGDMSEGAEELPEWVLTTAVLVGCWGIREEGGG